MLHPSVARNRVLWAQLLLLRVTQLKHQPIVPEAARGGGWNGFRVTVILGKKYKFAGLGRQLLNLHILTAFSRWVIRGYHAKNNIAQAE